ncbi:DNA polymerase delta subunit 2-like [Venturia canescens]|uniref:DNA polymerase delta subunit 2-like n=1 Tax=Venturia canescens TaxID=32260 RepID=UPI001C9D3526|nr:DNA polymerase delta subunit 2-like [Venturia canescens]
MVLVNRDDQESQLLKSDDGKPSVFERKRAQYTDYSSRFHERKTDFSKQFAHMYACRLAELRPILIDRVEAKWADIPIVKLADLEHQLDKRCIIIGTLYKHQQWKPSILRELNEETTEVVVEQKDHYCDEKDQPFLEDEMLRIKLVGDKVDIDEVITGVVCAILGHKTESGTFDMEDWCFPGCPLQSRTPITPIKGKLVLVSTLDLMNNAKCLSTSLLSEWISGMAGNLMSQSEQASVVRVLLTGNSVSSTSNERSEQDLLVNAAYNQESITQTSAAIDKLDKWLKGLLEHCCVTLMPGEHDPTNFMLPQKPFHRFMLQNSSRYAHFQGASNPWIGKVGNRLVTGSSGQPIEDIARVCGNTSKRTPLDWLERTLVWRHFCPTAPDTLPSHPYYEKDLFIMSECPDIYFVGNTNKFETKLWTGDNGQTVRLICVPQFTKTKSVVLVDMETLHTETISFGSN